MINYHSAFPPREGRVLRFSSPSSSQLAGRSKPLTLFLTILFGRHFRADSVVTQPIAFFCVTQTEATNQCAPLRIKSTADNGRRVCPFLPQIWVAKFQLQRELFTWTKTDAAICCSDYRPSVGRHRSSAGQSSVDFRWSHRKTVDRCIVVSAHRSADCWSSYRPTVEDESNLTRKT